MSGNAKLVIFKKSPGVIVIGGITLDEGHNVADPDIWAALKKEEEAGKFIHNMIDSGEIIVRDRGGLHVVEKPREETADRHPERGGGVPLEADAKGPKGHAGKANR